MQFTHEIHNALNTYDQEKGPFRHIFGDHPAIKSLRSLSSGANLFDTAMCFWTNRSSLQQGKASYKVYIAVLNELFKNNRNAQNYSREDIFKQAAAFVNQLQFPMPIKSQLFFHILKNSNLIYTLSELCLLMEEKKLDTLTVLNTLLETIDISASSEKKINGICEAIIMLCKNNIFTNQNCHAVQKAYDPVTTVEAIKHLNEHNLLTDKSRKIVQLIAAVDRAEALVTLKNYQLLTDSNIKVIAKIAIAFFDFAKALNKFVDNETPLTQAIFDKLVTSALSEDNKDESSHAYKR